MKMKMNITKAWAIMVAALLAAVSAQAADFIAATGDFSDTASWTNGVLPGAADPVTFVTSNQTMNVDADYTIQSITSTNAGNVVGGAGTLTINPAANNTVGIYNTSGTLQLNGNVDINNSVGSAFIRAATGSTVELTSSSTLTLSTLLRVDDGGANGGLIQLNGTLLGLSSLAVNHNNLSFNAGHDSSAWGGNVIMNGTNRKLTINGGTVGSSAIEFRGNFGANEIELNSTNAINGVNFRSYQNLTLDVNAGQDNMGEIRQVNAGYTLTINIEDLGAGEELWFADSSTYSWAGTVDVVGFRANTLKFGSSSAALTAAQLERMTTDGSGGAELDADGYLFFSGPPPVITGEVIVDFGTGTATNARPADVISSNGYSWAFSDTEPLITDPAGQNRTVYGGSIMTWDIATNYVPLLEMNFNSIVAQVAPGVGGGTKTMTGMYVWNKEDFLLGANGTVSVSNGNAMSFSIGFQWGGNTARLVVKQGGEYYVSDASAASGLLEIDPSSTNETWGIINTSDYSIGSYGTMTFTDIEAVGIYYTGARGAAGNCYLTFSDFQLRANVELPPVTEISDVSSSLVGDQLVMSWQGTNLASYAVQMSENLVFGQWSNVVENITGVNDLMSVTNATDAPAAFFRTILEN